MTMRTKPSIQRLKELYRLEHIKRFPSIKMEWRAIPQFTDANANGLTKCIIKWLQLCGHQAERINTMGRPIDNTQIVTNCIGQQRRIGSVQWIPSGVTKGSADISATVAGRSVKIEVKIGRDRQSDAQRRYQLDIERSGGVYIIVRTFEDFLTWYDTFTGEANHGN